MGDAQQSLPRAAFLRRIMKAFIGYWIAVLKLTQAQAYATFYRCVRYVSWSYDVEWGEYGRDEDD